MATQAIVRQINEIKTLRSLFERGPGTRAEIARRLGVTKSTTGHVVAGLIASGLVRDVETPTRELRGRPGTWIGLNAAGAHFAGAEIGVDRISVVLLDLAADPIGRERIDVPCATLPVDEVLDTLRTIVASVCERCGVSAATLKGVCASLPGYVTRDGVIRGAPRLGWQGFSVTERLQALFRCPVAIENDANAFAFAEWYLTPTLRDRDLLLVLLETGVGGGHISGGHLVRGAHGSAGEIGHMPLAAHGAGGPDDVPASWESVIGKTAVLSAARQRCAGCSTVAELRAAVRSRNAEAIDLAHHWARWLARGLAAMAHIHDPDEIIIGGELSALFEQTRDIVVAELQRCLLANFPPPRLSASRFEADGCAIGTAAIMHARLFSAVSDEPVRW